MSRWMPRSLAGRLALLLVGALVLSQLIAFGIFSAERSSFSRAVARTQVTNKLATLIRVLNSGPAVSADHVVRAFSRPRQRFWTSATPLVSAAPAGDEEVQTSDRVRRLIGRAAREVRIVLKPDAALAARRPAPRASALHLQALDVSVQLASGTWLNGEMLLRLPVAPWANIWLWLLATGVLGVLAAVLVGVRWITRPMVALADAAERIGRGETVGPLAIAGPVEVSTTVAAFNRMQDRLSRFMSERLSMLAAISHDLRTPITVARLRAEMIDDPAVKDALVKSLDDMKAIAESSLSFIRDELTSELPQATDIGALVESAAEGLRGAGWEVRVKSSPALTYRCRPAMMKRALTNLMGNACQYGKLALVSIEPAKHALRICIDDHGPGIPASQLEKVFEPFARGEPSRNDETGGLGLGLAIARSAIRAHGGEVKLLNMSEGLRAEIVLPW